MKDSKDLENAISQSINAPFVVKDYASIGGGCINEAYRVEGAGRRFFMKQNKASMLEMFEAEAEGLKELALAKAIRVPEVICVGVAGKLSYLVLEYIPMGGGGDAALMGKQLAGLHRKTAAAFGWYRNNTIGATPQVNTPEDSDWVSFYRDKRLRYQFDWAARRGCAFAGADALLERVGDFFEGYQAVPSLLHGDLWSGNASCDPAGNPVIYDPAVYYGDREAELAFTEMFGGFGASFYDAYAKAWPLDKGYAVRKDLYNLYHVLNHHNLFGGGYSAQAERMINALLQT